MVVAITIQQLGNKYQAFIGEAPLCGLYSCQEDAVQAAVNLCKEFGIS